MLRPARLEIVTPAALVGSWLAVSVGCATPGPVVRLHPPSTSDVTWVSGRAVQIDEEPGLRVAAAFDHQDGARLAVRLEIRNDTDDPVVVGPGDVTFMPCNAGRTVACPFSYPVIDPERMLLALDHEGEQQRASAANDEAVYVPLLLLSVVADVGSIASGQGHRRNAGRSTASLSAQMDASAARHESASLSIDAQRNLWSNAAFRQNTVLPGAAAGGLVYLPIHRDAHHLWVHVRAGGHLFAFRFEQKLISRPGAHARRS